MVRQMKIDSKFGALLLGLALVGFCGERAEAGDEGPWLSDEATMATGSTSVSAAAVGYSRISPGPSGSQRPNGRGHGDWSSTNGTAGYAAIPERGFDLVNAARVLGMTEEETEGGRTQELMLRPSSEGVLVGFKLSW